jgi:hypothetical protein
LDEVGIEKFPNFHLSKLTISHFITTDAHLKSWCGIQSFKSFDDLIDIVDTVMERIGYELSLLLPTRELLFLCLIKLKTGLRYSCLAPVFNISIATCSSYFNIMIDILYAILKTAIRWPDREEIRKTMPDCFRKYPYTRVILDCSETKIDKLNCLDCKVKTYSHYKGAETIKYMIGIDPAGRITFVSPTYGGRASDKHIFNDSGLPNLLQFGDGVMVDKGYDIEEEIAQINCKLIQPPFMKNKTRLSPTEAIVNANIAQVRIHVEHAFSRIKLFNILQSKLHYNLLHKADKILVVICGLVNLRTPILNAK